MAQDTAKPTGQDKAKGGSKQGGRALLGLSSWHSGL